MIDFILNPIAGKRKARKACAVIEKKMKELGIPFRLHETVSHGDGTIIAQKLTESGADTIIVVGGDGTLHEVLNGIKTPENLRFGIIPAGTGNDFAATLGIPSNPLKALEVILENNVQYVDYFTCSGVRGFNIIGGGIDVDILYHYEKKKKKNKFQYFTSLLHCLFGFVPHDVTVIKNGQKYEKKAFIACACNGRRFGGGIKICPKAKPQDGLLDVIVVSSIPKWKIPYALIKLVAGKIDTVKECEHYRAEEFIADYKKPVQIDGEIYENLPYNVKIIKNQLKMFLPTNND